MSTSRAVVPLSQDEKSKKIRSGLFRSMDPNGNGYLSLAEIEKGFMTVLQYGEEVRRVVGRSMARAHRGARSAVKSKRGGKADDYVQSNEFRIFIEYFRYDLHLLKLFLEVDSSDDHRISFEEYQKAIPGMSRALGLPLPSDLRAAFDAMDKDGGGMVLYDEFADWMIDHKVANPSSSVTSIAKAATSPRFSERKRKPAPKHSARFGSSSRTSRASATGSPRLSHSRTSTSTRSPTKRSPARSSGYGRRSTNGKSSQDELLKLFAEFQKNVFSRLDRAQAQIFGRFDKIETLLRGGDAKGQGEATDHLDTHSDPTESDQGDQSGEEVST